MSSNLIQPFRIVEVTDKAEAAVQNVSLCRSGEAATLMKGSLHTADGVLHNIYLVSQCRANIDRGIRDQQYTRIHRRIHDEDMTNPPRTSQPCLLIKHLSHKIAIPRCARFASCAVAVLFAEYEKQPLTIAV
jgi:hypothetical protein